MFNNVLAESKVNISSSGKGNTIRFGEKDLIANAFDSGTAV
jgi:hypothetical protein